jgi:hypothetical protein
MKSTLESILGRMAVIGRMERGKLCPMRGGRYYNLQSWEGGRNVVRYVPASEARAVAQAVEGYKKFMGLAERYADLVVQDTRTAALAARNEPKKVKKKEI